MSDVIGLRRSVGDVDPCSALTNLATHEIGVEQALVDSGVSPIVTPSPHRATVYVCAVCTFVSGQRPLGREGRVITGAEIDRMNEMPRPLPAGIPPVMMGAFVDALRDAGCDCRPRFTAGAATASPPMFTLNARHEPGCGFARRHAFAPGDSHTMQIGWT